MRAPRALSAPSSLLSILSSCMPTRILVCVFPFYLQKGYTISEQELALRLHRRLSFMEGAPLRTSERQVLAGCKPSCIAQVLGVPPGDEVGTRLAQLMALAALSLPT